METKIHIAKGNRYLVTLAFHVKYADSLYAFQIEVLMPLPRSAGILMARRGIELARAVTARRRKNIRFPLRAFVNFRWDDAAGHFHQGKGKSRDISEQGAFVETLVCPPVGTRTTVAIWIQRPESTRTQEIEFEGCVVRVEHRKKTTICAGFALKTSETFFSDIEDSLNGV